jgi:RND family efflux transporter MFP subunit
MSSPSTSERLADQASSKKTAPPPTPKFRPNSRRAPRWRTLTVRLCVGLVLLALVSWGVKKALAPTDTGTGDLLAVARRASLPITVVERGELESSKSTEVVCEMEGQQNKIISILPEGTKVKKGQVVLSFNAEELKGKYDEQKVKLEADVAKAKGLEAKLEVDRNKAEGDIDKARSAKELADVELKKYEEGDFRVEQETDKSDIELSKKDLQEAQLKLENLKKQVKQGFAPPESIRLQETELAKFDYKLKSAKLKLEVLEKYTLEEKKIDLGSKARDATRELKRAEATGKAAVTQTQTELAGAQVAVRLEKQMLERLEKQLKNTNVEAKEEGILVYSQANWWRADNRIQAGAIVWFRQPLFSTPDLNQMQMKVKVHEAMIKKITPGLKAEIRTEALGQRVLHGTVKSVATMATNDNWMERYVKEYEVIVVVDDLPANEGLKPGMSGEVTILVNTLPNVLVVPVQSIGKRLNKTWCYVSKNGKLEKREVTVGENNEKFVEIKSGLEEGESVTMDARVRLTAENKAEENNPDKIIEQPKPNEEPPPTSAPPAAAPKRVASTAGSKLGS